MAACDARVEGGRCELGLLFMGGIGMGNMLTARRSGRQRIPSQAESSTVMGKKLTLTDWWARHIGGREGRAWSSAKPRERGVASARSWAVGVLGLWASTGRGSGAGPLRRGKLKQAAWEEKGRAGQKARKGDGGKRNSFLFS